MDAIGILVGDLNAEFLQTSYQYDIIRNHANGHSYLLNGHDDLNGIQAVQAEVVGEVRSTVDLLD